MINLAASLSKRFKGIRPSALSSQDRADYHKIIGAFMHEPLTPQFSKENSRNIQAWLISQQIQGWTDKSDFPSGESFYPLQSPISALPMYDEGYKEFFKILDFTGSAKSGFRQFLLENTLEFGLVPSGDKAVIYNVKGTKEMIDFDKYGAGLEWPKDLFEDAEWVQIADILAAFRNAAFRCLALTHYDLMTYIFDPANPAVKADIDWQNPEPAALANTDRDYMAVRDAQTINLACQTIALACADNGYGVTPTSQFVVFTPLELRGRIRRALTITQQAFAGSDKQLDYNIRQVTSMMPRVPTTAARITDHYFVAFPGARAQSGMRLNLEELTEENIMARSTTQVDWLRFGAGIGDTDQIERCNIA